MQHSRSMVLLLPPAPAERVLLGRVFATLSARSAVALRRMSVRGPPGTVEPAAGELVRPVETPVLWLPPPPLALASAGEFERAAVDWHACRCQRCLPPFLRAERRRRVVHMGRNTVPTEQAYHHF